MFSDRLDVDVFHQPAEGAGLITPGLVADGGEDLVDGGLFERAEMISSVVMTVTPGPYSSTAM